MSVTSIIILCVLGLIAYLVIGFFVIFFATKKLGKVPFAFTTHGFSTNNDSDLGAFFGVMWIWPAVVIVALVQGTYFLCRAGLKKSLQALMRG